jgi:hypothetical protein
MPKLWWVEAGGKCMNHNLHHDEEVHYEQNYADLVQPLPAFVGQFQPDTAAYHNSNGYTKTVPCHPEHSEGSGAIAPQKQQ